MSKFKYKLTLQVTDLKESLRLDYVNLLRQLLYKNNVTVTPSEIVFKDIEEVEKIIEPQIFGARLGLITFPKEFLNQELQVELINDTSEEKSVYSEELKKIRNGVKIGAIRDNHLLLKLPPNSKLSFKLKFEEGEGINNAKFNTYSGYRYKKKGDELLVEFQKEDQLKDVSDLEHLL